MRRRWLLAGLPFLAGCGLSERPHVAKRDWPLLVPRPQSLAPAPRGPVLLVRLVQAGPGLEARGLRSLTGDGSVQTDFYESWAVPPAQGVEASLRAWLAGSGHFAAVLAPGSRMAADLVLEAALTEFIADPAKGVARAAMSLVVLSERDGTPRLRAQHALTGEAALPGSDAPSVVQALRAALAELLRATEQALAGQPRRA